MDILKKVFSLSFGVANNALSLIICILTYIIIGAICPIVLLIVGFLPVIGWILGIFSVLVGCYCLAGIALALLVFFNVLSE